MTLYSYVVRHADGFAPNPYSGYCTLACCKPGIRRRAQVGDWIVGLAPKAQGSAIIYFMRVDEVLTFEDYWNDTRFEDKKPRLDGETSSRLGDNIYRPLDNGDFRQLQSKHSSGINENASNKEHDLSGLNVLVSRTFSYFGPPPAGHPLPPALQALRVGRGYRCRFTAEIKDEFCRFAESNTKGGPALPLHGDSGVNCQPRECAPAECTPSGKKKRKRRSC
jgi:hypothetical protein